MDSFRFSGSLVLVLRSGVLSPASKKEEEVALDLTAPRYPQMLLRRGKGKKKEKVAFVCYYIDVNFPIFVQRLIRNNNITFQIVKECSDISNAICLYFEMWIQNSSGFISCIIIDVSIHCCSHFDHSDALFPLLD